MNYEKFFKYPISFPKNGAGGETGSWRIFKPEVDMSSCVYCGICGLYCPTSSISVDIKRKDIKIDYLYCKGCGLCFNVCPRKAIKMVEERV